ncbi:MAG TPA: sulfotransferase [Thermoanaerobaculia bacterium]|nr:sulfotransferase [Thermoanaerobaculia bacterium]
MGRTNVSQAGTEILVHVGVQRAASTFLQEQVFRIAPGIRYLGKHFDDYPDWMIAWHYTDPGRFSEQHDRIERAVRERIDPTRLNVMSSEGFCLLGGLAPLQADRLARILPEAKILVVLRDPLERMLSLYRYAARKERWFQPFEALIDWKEPPFVFYKRKPIYLPDYYYDEIVGAYRRLFGEGRVCVLRYETMRHDPDAFWTSLSDFAGVSLRADPKGKVAAPARNAAPAEDTMDELRRENLSRVVREAFPRASLHLPPESAAETPPISDALRERLIDRLRGRCGGYY